MDYTQEFTVERMCRVFKVSKSSYYNWRKNRSLKRQKESKLEDLIRYEYERSRCTYGSPRIALALNEFSYTCSKSTVARHMKKLGIIVRRKRKHKITTNSNHGYGIFPNTLNREFEQESPGKVWVSDITYIRIASQ